MAPSASRDRSRSPARPKKSTAGFKWKDKSASTSSSTKPERAVAARTGGDGQLGSSYRERSPKYDTHRRVSRSTERHTTRSDAPRPKEDRNIDHEIRSTTKTKPSATDSPPVAGPTSTLDRTSVAAKFGAKAAKAASASASHRTNKPAPSSNNGTTTDPIPSNGTTGPLSSSLTQPQSSSSSVRTAIPRANEPMIIVHVNDRLGTKAAIPCLASDPVKAFKAMVAARVGRPTHEILIKRQGERPFKDQLTLEDYGVSDGVQLDLELDTGD